MHIYYNINPHNFITYHIFPCPGSKFMTLVIPDSPGALFDLSNSTELASIINSFTRDKSNQRIKINLTRCPLPPPPIEPMCAVGFGVAGLFSTLDLHSQKWNFDKHSLTAVSEWAEAIDFHYDKKFVPHFFEKIVDYVTSMGRY